MTISCIQMYIRVIYYLLRNTSTNHQYKSPQFVCRSLLMSICLLRQSNLAFISIALYKWIRHSHFFLHGQPLITILLMGPIFAIMNELYAGGVATLFIIQCATWCVGPCRQISHKKVPNTQRLVCA